MTRTRFAAALVTALLAGTMLAPAALAHEERPSVFPPSDSERRAPEYREFSEDTPHVVVCKPDSEARINAMEDEDVKAFNLQLLAHGCDHEHLQAAVDDIEANGVAGTNVYLLPGEYREEPSINHPCMADYEGHEGAYEYEDVIACGEVINLVTINGDDPEDEDIACDNALCDLQVEGTGETPEDVIFIGGFDESGDWIKHNGIKADRADGIYFRNFTAELFRENAVYIHETTGYRIDNVIARKNDLYGILTFTSDHGIIENCDTYFNGDSGIYPGSAAEVNGDNTETGPLGRYAVEIRNCRSHHNALGYSGTAGNSVWIHDSEFFDNGAGIVTDSFVGGHPGMPQDHLWIENNRIYRNNNNYYAEYIHSGKCSGMPGERGYEDGTVCPAFPVPVGTGIMIAGGNYNFVNNNLIYDNWRSGAMLFYVPSILRSSAIGNPTAPLTDTEAALQPFTEDEVSNGNWYTENHLAEHPSGAFQPNGVDFWWDGQGIGNCWQDNTTAGDGVTTNPENLTGIPDCSIGSLNPLPNPLGSALLVPCAVYDREDNPDPEFCDWFDSPAEPAGRVAAADDPIGGPTGGGFEPSPDDGHDDDDDGDGDGGAAGGDSSGGGSLPATGGGIALAVTGLGLIGLAGGLRRRQYMQRLPLLPA